jgi:hypothetical protein
MPYESLRDYLSVLESHGLIQWVEKEVDKDWEISSLARQYFRKTTSRIGRPLVPKCEKLRSSRGLGLIGASKANLWIGLERALAPRSLFKPGNGALNIPWACLGEIGPSGRNYL